MGYPNRLFPSGFIAAFLPTEAPYHAEIPMGRSSQAASLPHSLRHIDVATGPTSGGAFPSGFIAAFLPTTSSCHLTTRRQVRSQAASLPHSLRHHKYRGG